MSEVLPTCDLKTCEGTCSVISLLESEDGAAHSNSQDGLQLDLFGQVVAPASPTASQAKAGASQTRETYGHISIGSSESAALTQSLASRLKERLGTVGSTVYAETWRLKATPSGRSYWAHTASARRTSGNASTGWPTPQTNEPGGPDRPSRAATGRTTEYLGRTVEKVTGWPTPNTMDTLPPRDPETFMEWNNSRDGRKNRTAHSNLRQAVMDIAHLAGWATPRSGKVTDEDPESWQARHERGEVATMPLTLQAQMSGCSIPTSQDAKNNAGPSQWERHSEALNVQASGTTQSSSRAGTEKRGALNPQFSLWLMGFPIEWAVCGARVTPSSRKSRRSS